MRECRRCCLVKGGGGVYETWDTRGWCVWRVGCGGCKKRVNEGAYSVVTGIPITRGGCR